MRAPCAAAYIFAQGLFDYRGNAGLLSRSGRMQGEDPLSFADNLAIDVIFSAEDGRFCAKGRRLFSNKP